MLFIVTGLSGAGKSTALHALEDLGVFCTDNLPVGMLRHWAEVVTQTAGDAAVGIDIRSTENPDLLSQALHAIRQDLPWKIMFIDAQDTVLQRRFSTVKRRHPYMPDAELAEAIAAERKALQALHDQADIVLNSSRLTPYQLGQMVESFWQKQEASMTRQQAMTCALVSFSYQRGLPHGADMVLDMRFLPNPHYEPELAPLTGKDALVQLFVRPGRSLAALIEVATRNQLLKQRGMDSTKAFTQALRKRIQAQEP